MKGLKTTGRITAVTFSAVILMGLTSGCGSKEKPAPTAQINFITDYRAALDAGREKGQDIIIDFYTDWCQW
jgi:thiol:disulfide interchange protein